MDVVHVGDENHSNLSFGIRYVLLFLCIFLVLHAFTHLDRPL